MTRALLKGQKCNKIVLKCAVDEMMEIVKKVLGSKKGFISVRGCSSAG